TLAGPQMHILHGWMKDIEVPINLIDYEKKTLHMEGLWKKTYEAQEYKKVFGLSDEPVCHTMTGYASGYLSTILGKKVIVKEIQCEAMGHEHCHAVCQTVEEWGEKINSELKYYE